MDIQVLMITALSIGFLHTLVGPDHYLPFILIARSRQWSLPRALRLTIWCGVGHVLSSVVLGLLGVALGMGVGVLEEVEEARGDLASWLLIGFGLAYAAWGLRLGLRAGEHTHPHPHQHSHPQPHGNGLENGHAHQAEAAAGPVHAHAHAHLHHHLGEHRHIHGDTRKITPWALFIIFVLGPCEPLIPILMYPAAQGSLTGLGLVTLVFGLTTITTMTVVVGLSLKGLLRLRLGFWERYSHALAGVAIAASGLAIKLFGL